MLDPRRLRVLLALADHGTVTAAARALHFSPSAISQHLAALEAEVGQALLERRGRRVTLTPTGRMLLGVSHSILAEIERAEALLAEHRAGLAGELVVAGFATAITHVIAPALARLREEHPAVRLRVVDAEGHRSLAMLLDGEVDLAIAVELGGASSDDRRVVRVPLFAEPFEAVLPEGHELAKGDWVALDGLAEEDWIAPEEGNPVTDVIGFACEQAGFRPRYRHAVDDFRTTAALVAAGAGVALVPSLAVRDLGMTGVAVRPLVPPVPVRRVFAAYRRGREQHGLTALVLATLGAVAGPIH
ncbi:LysR family transcriptional regulator [Bailinhaonella thermotolerans]|uniref:LysR family transcriptional regulator n=1 Tax=Bailinhaonella thermotolerans TaxID=1070861 RepID=A0A3A4B671_9ACTN|nr:LysR family transcriptional regulator [Bailinhaonella thermotolerans]RJL36130.1 LysR family transcriptional regulator [Bailinhaonella thermotolerans]